MQHGEEISAELYKPGCQPVQVLYFAEELLYDVAHGVEVRIVSDRDFGIGVRRDHR